MNTYMPIWIYVYIGTHIYTYIHIYRKGGSSCEEEEDASQEEEEPVVAGGRRHTWERPRTQAHGKGGDSGREKSCTPESLGYVLCEWVSECVSESERVREWESGVCFTEYAFYIHVHVIQTHTCTCTHTHMHTRTHTHTHTHTHAHIHTNIHT